MISTSEFFDTLTLDARRWPDVTDYYLHGPTRCALHVPPCLATMWTPAKIGCHWTHPKYPSAIVSSIVKRDQDGAQFSGYVAVVNFAEIGTFHTRQLAQRAVEVHLGA